MTISLRGKNVIDVLNNQLLQKSEKLRDTGITPTLAIVRLGERPDDLAYERGAMKRAEKTGVEVKRFLYPEDFPQEKLLEEFRKLNQDPSIHGILPFRPFPSQINDEAVRAVLSPDKDVDGITDASSVGVYSGTDLGFAPCTAEACIALLKHYEIPLTGKNVAVIGRSAVIGKPVSLLLLKENATVTMCHSKTENLPEICRRSDILICAAGHADTVTKECFREGQVVVDVAINFDQDGNMVGDAVSQDAENLVQAITPVPGGVGTVTSTILMSHVISAAEKTILPCDK